MMPKQANPQPALVSAIDGSPSLAFFGRHRHLLLIAALALLSLLVAFLSLGIGTSQVDLAAVLRGEPLVVWRLPRVALAAVAGGALAISGATFQALLRNPLADPYVVGVSGGAALGGVVALVLGLTSTWAIPLFAFGGAVGSVLLLFSLAAARGKDDPLTLLLAGVVFNAFAAAVVTFFKAIVAPAKAQEILFWLMGVISDDVEPQLLVALTIYCGIGTAVLLASAGALNLLSMGDDDAASLGLPVARARLLAFGAAALLVGSVVAVTGMIGFVGLVVPHVLRRLLGADHAVLLPAALFGGAIFLMLADTITRLSFHFFGNVVPIGVVTAFAGGPFFLALLLRR